MTYFLFFSFLCPRGQPAVIQPERKHKDILFTGLVGDGSLLPPVIITSDDCLPEMTFNCPAHVILLPSSKAPGEAAVKAWFDNTKDWLADEPLLLLDNLKAHHNPQFLEELRDFGIDYHFYPSHTGALIDPCDNSFHSVLKRIFLTKDRSTHEKSIRAMVESYYDVSERTILNCFERCGYLGPLNPAQATAHVLSQGYQASQQKISELRKCEDTYIAWKRVFRSVISQGASAATPTTLPNDTLDGTYWHTFIV